MEISAAGEYAVCLALAAMAIVLAVIALAMSRGRVALSAFRVTERDRDEMAVW